MKKFLLLASFLILLLTLVVMLSTERASDNAAFHAVNAHVYSDQERLAILKYFDQIDIRDDGTVVDKESGGAYFSKTETDIYVAAFSRYWLEQGFVMESRKGTQDGNTYLVPFSHPLKGTRAILVKRILMEYKIRIQ
ncbi:hypothetical protein [Persicobacter diffluens]|uniref:Uncharacterized protein n=1 Tax=Persicobacter diffluens TaxID=981 RepID=A0AAN5AM26_9BACT|nr:hypothetical protein PEDI_45060 [Persicobacter diffluens]